MPALVLKVDNLLATFLFAIAERLTFLERVNDVGSELGCSSKGDGDALVLLLRARAGGGTQGHSERQGEDEYRFHCR